MKPITLTGKLLALFASALAMVAKADFPMYIPEGESSAGQVSLANGNPGAVNIAAILNLNGLDGDTYWKQRLIPDKNSPSKYSMYLYGRKGQNAGWYSAEAPKEPKDTKEIKLWSNNCMWPATIVRLLDAGGESVYEYGKEMFQTPGNNPQYKDDRTKPNRTKVPRMQIKECLERLFGPPTRKDISSESKFIGNIKSFEKGKNPEGSIIIETAGNTTWLNHNYAYGLISFDGKKVYLSNPARGGDGAWKWDLTQVSKDLKWAWKYDPNNALQKKPPG